jgi:hypothetical protein
VRHRDQEAPASIQVDLRAGVSELVINDDKQATSARRLLVNPQRDLAHVDDDLSSDDVSSNLRPLVEERRTRRPGLARR